MKITKEYSKTHSKDAADADYAAAYVAASAAVDADYADAKTKIVNHGIKLIGDLK